MQIRAPVLLVTSRQLLTIDMITRASIELFMNSNAFLKQLDAQWDQEFGQAESERCQIGQTMGIRLPNEFPDGSKSSMTIA